MMASTSDLFIHKRDLGDEVAVLLLAEVPTRVGSAVAEAVPEFWSGSGRQIVPRRLNLLPRDGFCWGVRGELDVSVA